MNKENKNLKSDLNEKLINEINNINKEINGVKRDTYKLKIEFQRDLLERVYPVGSYYWSSNNILQKNYLEENGNEFMEDFFLQQIKNIL